ncbi:proline-rich protein 2-like [Cuculus canorus]|uniref:proline-rich protein 2-like n=1 Tax=Cuculus canorus TaxID=55661 RepID=UPI0023AB1D44|nr:proline-rich protein 2-like [Cuculus canorus]
MLWGTLSMGQPPHGAPKPTPWGTGAMGYPCHGAPKPWGTHTMGSPHYGVEEGDPLAARWGGGQDGPACPTPLSLCSPTEGEGGHCPRPPCCPPATRQGPHRPLQPRPRTQRRRKGTRTDPDGGGPPTPRRRGDTGCPPSCWLWVQTSPPPEPPPRPPEAGSEQCSEVTPPHRLAQRSSQPPTPLAWGEADSDWGN